MVFSRPWAGLKKGLLQQTLSWLAWQPKRPSPMGEGQNWGLQKQKVIFAGTM